VNATSSAPLLDAEHAAFIQKGISITVGARDARHRPTLVRVLGCAVSGDRRQVRLLVAASQAGALLANVRENGEVAAVFSEPSTHRTIQLKGTDARAMPPEEGDFELAVRHVDAFVAHLGALGYRPELVRSLLHAAPEDLVAIVFSPGAAFAQTPGPGAGARLAGAAR
jgi:hypothetical protein